jgi:1-aminocyclopropane-1-carboxylate deaminase/D-cysteine desulfhydrase-like pyridoxal-dependent ACC family enzyme
MMNETNLPRRTIIGLWPTPLQEMVGLSRQMRGPRIFFKREDLSGFALGGNKTRQLEYIWSDFENRKCDTMIVSGGIHSNFIRILSAWVMKAGKRMIAVYFGTEPVEREGNHLLCDLLGIEQVFTGNPDRSSTEIVAEALGEKLRQQGARPFILPRGGSTPLGCLGYFHMMEELRDQGDQKGLSFDHIVIPTGSCGTLAGALAGAPQYELKAKIWGISVSRSRTECEQRVRRLSDEASALAGLGARRSSLDYEITDDSIGLGYGLPTEESQKAIELVARSEGVFLDPVFTGKAFAGMTNLIRKGRIGPDSNVLFIHCGGAPSLFVPSKSLCRI